MGINLRLRFICLLLVLTAVTASSQVLTDSNLPIVIITTDTDPATGEPFAIADDPRVMANMKIVRRANGARNYVTDQNTPGHLNYNGRISIEIRGSSSQWLFKKGYGLTTLMPDGVSNNNVALLDMPQENDWVLNGLAFDPSLIRDHLSYRLFEMMGNYSPRTEFCEVIVNSEYVGLYLLQEKIKPDSDRVNIEKMTSLDNSLPMLSGGYITKADKLTGGDPVAFTTPSYAGVTEYVHDHPKPEDITSFQHNFIRSQFQNLGTASATNNSNLTTGYPAIIDLPSFVDFIVINEISSNADGYQLSSYFHKDRGGKLRAGPIWDFNLTYGNDLFMWGYDRSHYDIWQLDNGDNTGSKFWKDLFLSPPFRCALARRWNELSQPGQPLHHDSLVEFIDGIVALTAEATIRENQQWGTVNTHVQEIVNLKLFLYNRINWINEHIGSFAACSDPVLPPLVISRIHYNPNSSGGFSSNNSEFIEITNNGSSTVPLAGIYLREPGVNFQFESTASVGPGQKVYIASNLSVFQNRYGLTATGQFTRNLPNSTHRILLSDAWGNTIDEVHYDDDAPWPDADGNGLHLQLLALNLDNALAQSWIASGAPLNVNSFGTSAINVYPNPVSDWLNVEVATDNIRYSVSDIRGKILQVGTIGTGNKIDCSSMASGLYFLEIKDSSGARKTVKFIRE